MTEMEEMLELAIKGSITLEAPLGPDGERLGPSLPVINAAAFIAALDARGYMVRHK